MKDNDKNQLLKAKKFKIDPNRKSKKIEPKPADVNTNTVKQVSEGK